MTMVQCIAAVTAAVFVFVPRIIDAIIFDVPHPHSSAAAQVAREDERTHYHSQTPQRWHDSSASARPLPLFIHGTLNTHAYTRVRARTGFAEQHFHFALAEGVGRSVSGKGSVIGWRTSELSSAGELWKIVGKSLSLIVDCSHTATRHWAVGSWPVPPGCPTRRTLCSVGYGNQRA